MNAWGDRPKHDKLRLGGPSELDGIVFDVTCGVQPESLLLHLHQLFAECVETLTCPETPGELTGLLYSSCIRSLAVAA